jgi:hypothetical protein
LSIYQDVGEPFESVNVVLQEITPGAANIVLFGCWDSTACNYNPNANYNSGVCLGPNEQCDDGDVNTINDIYNDSCSCVGTLVGVSNLTISTLPKLYPIPTSELLNFQWLYSGGYDWMISDFMGRNWLFGSSSDDNLELNVQGLSSGVYSFKAVNRKEVVKMTFVIH